MNAFLLQVVTVDRALGQAGWSPLGRLQDEHQQGLLGELACW